MFFDVGGDGSLVVVLWFFSYGTDVFVVVRWEVFIESLLFMVILVVFFISLVFVLILVLLFIYSVLVELLKLNSFVFGLV